MRIEDWQELSIKAPSTFGRCLQYFEHHYSTNWHHKMNSFDRILEFLSGEGVGIRICCPLIKNGVMRYMKMQAQSSNC